MPSIDLNCDLGESFGAYTIGMDAEILPYVTSANIACGFHAGDPSVMQKSVLLCKKYGVQVGAHPGLPDLQGFGRRSMAISPAEAEADVMYQIGALKAFCDAAGVPLHHVKPHGALYNMAAKNLEENTFDMTDWQEVKAVADGKGGLARTKWCGSLECELKMKEQAGVSSRCMPLKQSGTTGKCVCCGKECTTDIYWGVAY